MNNTAAIASNLTSFQKENIEPNPLAEDGNLPRRIRSEKYTRWFLISLATMTILFLVAIISDVFYEGFHYLDWQFITSFPSRFYEKSGIYPALLGTVWLVGLALAVSIPISVGAAIYLEEIAPPSKFKSIIDINIANLAGVPSIVYGILGLAVFVRFFSLDRSLLAGGFTLGLLVLPIMISTCREALAAVPNAIKQAALCLGASKIETIFYQVLPIALPSMLSGVILSVSRIIGETAPLLIIGAASYISYVPESVFDEFSAIPIQIYNWAARPQQEFHLLAASGIVVLLVVVFIFNISAIVIRNKYTGRRL